MSDQTPTRPAPQMIEGLTAAEIRAGFEAVIRWLDAAGNSIKILDNFGEHAPAERLAATVESLDTVITKAVAAASEPNIIRAEFGTRKP